MINRLKQIARRFIRQDTNTLPDANYQAKLENEIAAFSENEEVHDLPDIFHYWSNKYLVPLFKPFGIAHPEQFYLKYTLRAFDSANEPVKILSIGAGNCDMETRLAMELVKAGKSEFSIECTDINQAMLDRGLEYARENNVDQHMIIQTSDFNRWRPEHQYHVVIANQCLHHVVELEHLFTSINQAMSSQSVFLTSDMIGRNGHQRWPEALDLVNEFWQELPEAYRWNRLMKRQEDEYINQDCSDAGFEGIRAQDILALLVDQFKFELFLPFSNIVTVFIDRPFGGNFDANGQWDREFIDRVHVRDEQGMLTGELKPTQMLAVLRLKDFAEAPRLWHRNLTPEACIRPD